MTILPTVAGYFARRRGMASERLGAGIMTLVLVFGYSIVGFLSIWANGVDLSYLYLPLIAGVYIIAMVWLGLLAGRLVGRDAGEVGLFGLATGLGNTGFTVGGFVVFLLQGTGGLALVSVYGLIWTPLTILMTYPIARHYASDGSPQPLGPLLLRSIFDWRSAPLPVVIAALLLAEYRVPCPAWVEAGPLMDTLVYVTTVAAYFAIGVRLHVERIMALRVQIAALACTRFGLGILVALGVAGLASLTPWPLTGAVRQVWLVEACVPVAVTVVGVANMFNLKPREASALFVANTVTYLALVLPIVLIGFAR